MKHFFAAILLLSMSSSAFAHDHFRHSHNDDYDRPQHMSCYQKGMDNFLLNEDGEVLKQFVFETDCQQAASQQVDGFTCATDNASGTDLINSVMGSIAHVTFATDCAASLAEASSGLICIQDNAYPAKLIDSEGRQINTFTFKSDCETAREQMLGH